MISNRILLVAATVAGAALAGSPDYEPIPPAAWNLTVDDSEGTGAIVLDRKLAFDGYNFQYFYRIRILNEAGKNCISSLHLADRVEDLRGRTVTRAGVVVPFQDKKDLIKKTDVALGFWKNQHMVVVPAGVTSDCVVDIGWREPQMQEGRIWRYSTLTLPLAMAWPIAKETISIPDAFHYGWSVRGGDQTPEVTGEKDKLITLKGLPALPTIPLALESARDIPRLTLYHVPNAINKYARGTGEHFWEKACREHYRQLFGNFEAGRVYRHWAAELLAGLPSKPQAAAYELALRLDAKIKNRTHPTYQEADALRRDDVREEALPTDLDEAVRRGRTTSEGMVCLYYQLLKDAGLPAPKLLLVADRDERLMDATILNVNQHTAVLVGVAEEGRPTLWVDLNLRFAQPGLIHPDYQGTPALCVDTATWTPEWTTVPSQAARNHVRSYAYRLDIGEEEDAFQVDAAFTGYPEYKERSAYMALDDAGQAKRLRETLEKQDKRLQLTRTEVQNAVDPRKNVRWHAEGRREREGGRRLRIEPFPVLPAPIPLTDTWPEGRNERIVLPYAGTVVASATFRIPDGYRLLPVDRIVHRNSFGSVAWLQENVAGPKGPEAKVVLRVDLEQAIGGPEAYRAIQDFTAWVRAAMVQTIMLEKI